MKKSLKKKDAIIKRLRTQHYREKRKIETLTKLLDELKKECNLSSNCCEILQVNKI